MLQSIRDRAQNWIFLAIIFLLVIAFAFWGTERFFEGGSSSKVVAKVDGYKITQDQFQATYQRMKRQLQLQLGQDFNFTPKIEKNLKKSALQHIINNYILTQAAENEGFIITQDQLDSVLMSLPLFQVNGQFSQSRFQNVLTHLFYTETSFFDELRTSLLVDQLQLGLINSTFVLPSEVKTAYQLINQERDISYIIIPTKRFENKVKITEQQKQDYYQSHQKQFSNPESVSIAYLELSLANLTKGQKFTEAQLKSYYEGNLNSYTLPARLQAAQILIRLPEQATAEQTKVAKQKFAKVEELIKQGKPFANVAKKYSDDVATAKKGGVLPWFTKGSVDPAVYDALKNLKINQVSQPVQTKYGISIFKLLAKKPEKVETFAEVKDRIKNTLAQQNAEKLFASQSDELSNLTFSDSGSLQSAAKALNLKIQTTPEFTRKGLKEGIASNPRIVNAAFSNTVLAEKYNSDPIPLKDGSIVVLRVKHHTPSSVKPYSEVANQIETLLKDKAEAQAAEKLGESIVQAVKTEKQLKDTADNYNLPLVSKTKAPRHDSTIPGAILQNAFDQANPQNGNISIDGLTLSNGDYAVVAVNKLVPGELKDLDSTQAKIYREQLSKQQGSLDYNLYAHQQINAASVKME